MAIVDLHIPISEDAIRSLHVGDQVRLYGVMVTARDAAHKYIKDSFLHGPAIPESELRCARRAQAALGRRRDVSLRSRGQQG